jgi:hypothetical protein
MTRELSVDIGDLSVRNVQLKARERILRTSVALVGYLHRSGAIPVSDESALETVAEELHLDGFSEHVVVSSCVSSVPADHVAVSVLETDVLRLSIRYVIRSGEEARGVERANLWLSGMLEFDRDI